MGFLYGIVVQWRTNLTWQLILPQIQRCQCRESSNLTGNRTCRRVQNVSTISTWWVVQWDYCMGFWYNVVLILPDRELPQRSRYVSSVRAPISVGIFPTKITRLVWGDNDSFNGIFVWDSGTMSYKYYLTIDWSTDTAVSVPWELQSHWESDLQKSSKLQYS